MTLEWGSDSLTPPVFVGPGATGLDAHRGHLMHRAR
jgi:hypothetical protein